MSNDNSFDDLVRKKLEGEEDEIAPASWSAIEKQLPPQAKRAVFTRKRYLLLLLLLLVSVSGVLLINKDDHSKKTTQALPVVPPVDSPSTINITPVGTPSSTVNDDAATSAATSTPPTTAAVSSFDEKDITTNSRPEARESSIAANSSGTRNESPATTSASAGGEESLPVTGKQNAENESLSSGKNTDADESYLDIGQQSMGYMNYLPVHLDLGTTPDMISSGMQNPNQSPLLPVEKKPRSIGVFVEAFYSPDYSLRSMSVNKIPNPPTTTLGKNEDYLQLRKNTETYYYSHSYGVRAGYMFSKRLGVKTGLDLTQAQERLSYTYVPGLEEAIRMGLIIDTISGTLIDPLNSSAMSNDTIIGNYQVAGQVTVPNYYKYYNVPLMFTFTLGNSKIKWVAAAGPFVNVGLKTKATIINTDRVSRINLEENKEQSPYRSSVGWGAGAEFVLSYELRDNISFIVGPHAKYYFKNISKGDAPLNERFFNCGLLTGFKISF